MLYFLPQSLRCKTPEWTFGPSLCRALNMVGEQGHSYGKSREQLFLWYFSRHYIGFKLHQKSPASHFWKLITNSLHLLKTQALKKPWEQTETFLGSLQCSFFPIPQSWGSGAQVKPTDLHFGTHCSFFPLRLREWFTCVTLHQQSHTFTRKTATQCGTDGPTEQLPLAWSAQCNSFWT